jgi:oxygen-independent coproporphyrinogen-3 oxidase
MQSEQLGNDEAPKPVPFGDKSMKPDVVACNGQEGLLPRHAGVSAGQQFSTAVGADRYAEWLKAIPSHARASLYLHVPFCRSLCWYCGGHTSVTHRDDPIAVYEAALRCEIDMVSRQTDRRITVDHIRFGGGTPTVMAPESFADLVGSLRHAFFVLPTAEIAVEIDPRRLDAAMTGALALGGINRASLGVPSLDPLVQRAINRVQSFEQTAAATKALRRAGVAGIDFDLVYGLPHQTVASCLDTVRRSVQLRPDRFAVSGYLHAPALGKHQRMINQAWLPDRLARLDQSSAIANALTEAGYLQIDSSHFALPGDAMAAAPRGARLRRNFRGATDTSDILLGFGASAIGRLPQGYVQNEIDIRAYSALIAGGALATASGYAFADRSYEIDRASPALLDRSFFAVRGTAAGFGAQAARSFA